MLRAEATLGECERMGMLVQAAHAARSQAPESRPLNLGVPPWAQRCPAHLYSDGLRRLVAAGFVLWTFGTVFWAFWQVRPMLVTLAVRTRGSASPWPGVRLRY